MYYSDPNIYATVEYEDYPFGTMEWTVYNEPCYKNNISKILLNFNACGEDEFNCADGSCVQVITFICLSSDKFLTTQFLHLRFTNDVMEE